MKEQECLWIKLKHHKVVCWQSPSGIIDKDWCAACLINHHLTSDDSRTYRQPKLVMKK